MTALTLSGINKTYDDFVAVRNISFSISEGSMFGLLGPNGAGKTTTMRMVMNIIRPDSGSILLFGRPFTEESKVLVGYLPEERGLYQKMSVIDHLQFLGEMKGLRARESRERARHWLAHFRLSERERKKIQELSKGLQQQVQFISTILHHPRLLIIDEPFTGLDPVNTGLLIDTLRQLQQEGTTIILSTHLMDQAERLCDTICLIHRGEVVLNGAIGQLMQQYGRNSVVVEYSGDGAFLKTLDFVESCKDYGNSMEVQLRDQQKPQRLLQALAASDMEVRRFETSRTSLNGIFIQLVEGRSNG